MDNNTVEENHIVKFATCKELVWMKLLKMVLKVNWKLDFMCITRHRVYVVEDIRNSDSCWVILVFK